MTLRDLLAADPNLRRVLGAFVADGIRTSHLQLEANDDPRVRGRLTVYRELELEVEKAQHADKETHSKPRTRS